MTTPMQAAPITPIPAHKYPWLGPVQKSEGLLEAEQRLADLERTREFLTAPKTEEDTSKIVERLAELKVAQTQLLKKVALDIPGAREELDKSRGESLVLTERMNHAEHLSQVRIDALEETQQSIIVAEGRVKDERAAIWKHLWEQHGPRLIQEAQQAAYNATILRVLSGCVSPRSLDDISFWHDAQSKAVIIRQRDELAKELF